jgi:hypothetical protein
MRCEIESVWAPAGSPPSVTLLGTAERHQLIKLSQLERSHWRSRTYRSARRSWSGEHPARAIYFSVQYWTKVKC